MPSDEFDHSLNRREWANDHHQRQERHSLIQRDSFGISEEIGWLHKVNGERQSGFADEFELELYLESRIINPRSFGMARYSLSVCVGVGVVYSYFWRCGGIGLSRPYGSVE